MDPEKAFQLRSAVVWAAVIAAAHFALGTRTHSLHGLHILLGGLFMVPVLKAAVAFELRGGLTAAAAVSGLYLGHLLWSWRDSPMANPDQYAMIGVYFVVGVTAGHLVKAANFRKWQRDEVIRRSRQTEMVQGLTGLLTALAVRDADTLAHSRRVAGVAVKIGSHMGLDHDTLVRLRLAALVHDIGKTGLPDDILFKNGSLTEEQTVLMRNHVDIAVGMLRPITGTEDIARIVSMHHECPDGSGYPKGLVGDTIVPEARVLRVADVFAAITEPRTYHTPLGVDEALAHMEQLTNTKIDAAAFAALKAIIQGSHGRSVLEDPEADAARSTGAPA
jgi:putative nucleotidyltransferase with HDIG domain